MEDSSTVGVDSVSPDTAALTCSDADTSGQQHEDALRFLAEDGVVSKSSADVSEPEPSDGCGKSAGLSNGDCRLERLEIVEPLPGCGERVSPECTAATRVRCDGGVTAAPDVMESSSGAAGRELHVDNGTGAIRYADDDEDDSGSQGDDAAATTCGLGDGEQSEDSRRHRVVDEEVDGRGMLFSENDVELGSGEREWTRRVSSRVLSFCLSWLLLTFTCGCK